MVSSQLEIVSKQLVKPSSPTPHSLRHLKLSFLDQVQNFVANYIPLIFFYQNVNFPSKIDPSQRSHQLKQSLSETLTKFYPFAGRINGNASIDCNDSGALYVEARVRAHISEAIQNATTKDLEQYLPVHTCPNPWRDDRSNRVLLAVQTSFFECGGMAFAVCLSHAMADAHSLLAFMKVWAQECSSTAEISVGPDFDIRLNRFPPIDMLAVMFENRREHNPSPPEEKIVMTSFYMEAFDRHPKAKSHDTKRAFVAFHAVNMRPRISPPLPDFAIGSISVLTAALCESENSRDYFNLVSPLRTAIRNVSDNYIDDEQKRWEYFGSLGQREPEKEYYSFSSWCRFPYYEVDYGWGKPSPVCTTSQPFKNTMVGVRSGDAVQAWITMAEDEMAMLPHEFLALECNDFRQ